MLDHDTDAYYEIARAFVDGQPSGNLTRDHILDNVMQYWLTGSGASAARSYWEAYGPDAPAAGRPPLAPPTIPFASLRSPARSGGRRAARWRRATRTCSTSTRSTRGATSLRGKSPSFSRPRCAPRLVHFAERCSIRCVAGRCRIRLRAFGPRQRLR
jgi:hypothetical protein